MTTDYLGRQVIAIVERPRGSHHPDWGWRYPEHYGYVPDTVSADGEELDAYIFGEPVDGRFHGVCIAVILRPDGDDKLVLVPEGTVMSEGAVRERTHFQEQFFESRVVTLERRDRADLTAR